MQLNFAATKTAALVAPRGPGAKQAKATLFARPTLRVLREHAAVEQLPLASSYRQVGVVHHPGSSRKRGVEAAARPGRLSDKAENECTAILQ